MRDSKLLLPCQPVMGGESVNLSELSTHTAQHEPRILVTAQTRHVSVPPVKVLSVSPDQVSTHNPPKPVSLSAKGVTQNRARAESCTSVMTLKIIQE
ncbi:hypothetical protein BaRGS_00007515 [Batillaria attramentaria]|uniref:Uncharacterized protein n=1 Tax=Batillaria attramentaria TaxID=370345 RepID=A0ABD0LQ99_9CAEN